MASISVSTSLEPEFSPLKEENILFSFVVKGELTLPPIPLFLTSGSNFSLR